MLLFIFLPPLSYLLHRAAYINGIPNKALMAVSVFTAIPTPRRCPQGRIPISFLFSLASRNDSCRFLTVGSRITTARRVNDSLSLSSTGTVNIQRRLAQVDTRRNSFFRAQTNERRHPDERLVSLANPPHSLLSVFTTRLHSLADIAPSARYDAVAALLPNKLLCL